MELRAEWQWKRWDAVARLGAGKLTLQEAARVLSLSVRQVHAGQVPVNKLRAVLRNRILRLRRTKSASELSAAGACLRYSCYVGELQLK